MCHWTVRRDTGIQRSRLYIIQIPWMLNWTQQLDNNLDLTLWGSWWLHALCLSWILGSKGEDYARNSCLPISILSFFLTEIDCSSLRQGFCLKGFPGGSDGKESTCNVGDPGLIPGSRKIPGGGRGNPLQYSCLKNPMDRGACWATVHGMAKSQT